MSGRHGGGVTVSEPLRPVSTGCSSLGGAAQAARRQAGCFLPLTNRYPPGRFVNPPNRAGAPHGITSRAEPVRRGCVVSLPPFEHVVAEHSRVVLRVCRALLPAADAEDAAAETFLAALRAYPRLRPDSDVRAWLVTIAHRKAIDVHRTRARSAVPLAELPERPAPPVDAANEDGLWDAVRALPEKQRAAVAYRYV